MLGEEARREREEGSSANEVPREGICWVRREGGRERLCKSGTQGGHLLGGEGRARGETGHLLLPIVADHTPNRNNTRPMPGLQRRLLQAYWSLLGEVLQCTDECQDYTLDKCF